MTMMDMMAMMLQRSLIGVAFEMMRHGITLVGMQGWRMISDRDPISDMVVIGEIVRAFTATSDSSTL